MKIKTEFVLPILLIAGLSLYLVLQQSGKTHYQLPRLEELKAEDISRIEIRQGAATLTLVREGGAWRVGPEKFAADKNKVRGLTDPLTDLTLTALASESKNYNRYDLDEEKRIQVSAFGGDKLLRRIAVGKTASSHRHTFVMIHGDPRVYHAEGNLHSLFSKKVSDLRDRTVLDIAEEVSKLAVTQGAKTLTLVKATAPVSVDLGAEKGPEAEEEDEKTEPRAPAVHWATAQGKPADQEAVEEMVRTLSHLQCDDFLTERKKQDLTGPIYTVSLEGAKTYTLSLFEKEQERYPAVSSENDYPFLISEWKAKRIMKDPESLERKKEKKEE